MLLLRRHQRGRIAEVNRTRSPVPAGVRSRTFTRCTPTGPIPVWTVRAGPWPCRTNRARPSSSCRSAINARKAAASLSIAWASRRRAPERKTAVNGSSIASGCRRRTTVLSSFMAYRSAWRFWQAGYPPRYAASFRPSSPSFGHSSFEQGIGSTHLVGQGGIMRTILSFAAILMLVSGSAWAESPREGIEAANKKFEAAFNKNDIAGLAQLYTSDAAATSSRRGPGRGPVCHEAYWKDVNAGSSSSLSRRWSALTARMGRRRSQIEHYPPGCQRHGVARRRLVYRSLAPCRRELAAVPRHVE